MLRVGIGYDVHELVAGRPLILGGAKIPHHVGLKGHSDADVLVHAVMDALLGAAGCGDIGRHFPDHDPQYKDISSLVLLKKAAAHLSSQGWVVGNVDAVVIAQAPKISPYIEQMRLNMAREIGVTTDLISVKATTTEGLGFAGRGEGIAAQAVACIYKVNDAG